MEKFFTREEDGFFFTLEAISEVKYFLVSSSSSLVNRTLFLFLHLHSPSASCRMEPASPLAVCVTLSLCAMLPLFWKRWHAHAQLSLHDVSPVCVPSWDSCREMRLASTFPHCSRTVVDSIFLTFVRRGSTEKHFFFYCLDVAVHVRQLPWDHCGLKACPFYVAGQSMAQCDLCNLPTWTSLGRWVSFMLNLHNLSCAPSPT